MARSGQLITIGAAYNDGQYVTASAGNDGGTALATDLATLSTAIGVLVADGASPTQADVTTANNALTLVNADIAAVQGNLALTWDTAKFTNLNQFKRAFDALILALKGSGIT